MPDRGDDADPAGIAEMSAFDDDSITYASDHGCRPPANRPPRMPPDDIGPRPLGGGSDPVRHPYRHHHHPAGAPQVPVPIRRRARAD